jgi:hypothetical protein
MPTKVLELKFNLGSEGSNKSKDLQGFKNLEGLL